MQTMSKLCPKCILRCSPNEIHIVVPRGTDAVEAYMVLDDTEHFFREYRVESNFNDQVNLEVSTEMLCQALKLITQARDVTMKLAKRDAQPTLNFEIVDRSNPGQEVAVLHEVAVTVKKARDMTSFKTPDEAMNERSSTYQIISSFPDLAEVRVVAERMRALDPSHDSIVISANRTGDLRIAMQGDEVKVETQWQDLHLDDVDNDRVHDNARHDALSRRFRHVRLDGRAFLKFLACQLIDYTAEVWLVPKTCATFVVHVRTPGVQDRSKFVAHLMVNLPGLSRDFDEE